MGNIRILGSGSFVPDQIVTNDEILAFLGPPQKPNGTYVDSSWLEEKFGISERRFDFDFSNQRKKTPEEGGIYDVDMAVIAVERALAASGHSSRDIDCLIHVSCTPDLDPRCLQNMVPLAKRLNLRDDVDMDYLNLGCAGLAKGFRDAFAAIHSGLAKIVVLVASNTTSAQLIKSRYVNQHREGFEWSWLSPAVFADGAGAVILSNDAPFDQGMLSVACATNPTIELVRFPGGGGLRPTSRDNVDDHVYLMDAAAVSRVFSEYMHKNIFAVQEALRTKPGLASVRSLEDFKRVYIHQANGPLVRQFSAVMGLGTDCTPINIDRYGNTSSASTLLLLDEDMRSGAVLPGDLVLFLWIGAGIGTMYGHAIFRL